MNRTIVGLFDQMAEAEEAVKKLMDGGFSTEEVSLVAHRAKCGPPAKPVETGGKGPTVGAMAAIGGVAGFTAGVVALAVPGIGPLIAAGPIAAELVAGGVGAATGAVLGGLKQRGVPEDEAGCFCEAVRRGGILVSVTTSDEKAPEAESIIGQHHLVDIEDCEKEWREKGWTGFDPEKAHTPASGLPYDPESIRPSTREKKRERRAVRSYFRVP